MGGAGLEVTDRLSAEASRPGEKPVPRGAGLAALALHLRHLVQAAAQALLPLEAGAQERLHQLHRQRVADDARAQAKHVHIVVLDSLARGVRVVTEGSADAPPLLR